MISTASIADATQPYLGWGRLASGLALLVSVAAGVIVGEPWYLWLIRTGGLLLAGIGLATRVDALRRRPAVGPVLDGVEVAVFGVLLAGGLDEDTAYVAVIGLLMLVLGGLRGTRTLRMSVLVAVVAEVLRQGLGQQLMGEVVHIEESILGLGLSGTVGLVVARMVDLARGSETLARAAATDASQALARAERAIGQLEAMQRVVARGLGERKEETLQRIVEEVAASVGLPYVTAVLLDDAGRPRIAATTDPDVGARDDIDPLAPGPFARGSLARALSGQATRVDDREVRRIAEIGVVRGAGALHPMTRPDGRVIGALTATVPAGQQIDDHEFRTLGLLAAQASLAIEAARALHREAELAERYRDLDRMKTDFIAITSHELRTPLTTISGVVEVFQQRRDELRPQDTERLLQALQRQTRRLARLVDDLRTVSLADAGSLAVHPRPADVAATVHEIVGSLPDVDTRVQVDDPLPSAWADPDRVAQVVSNLLVNGDQHGVAPVHVHVAPDDDGVVVRVWDQGPGIPPEHRSEVFERFARLGDTETHSRGSGLGLFIARQLAEAMDGSIEIVDHPSGSAFRLWLPSCPDGQ